MILSSQFFDPFSHSDEDGNQLVRPDVRTPVIQNIFRRTEFNERPLYERAAKSGILDGGIELAVGESARSALTELDVALRVERTSLKETGDLCRPCQRVLSSFENDGLHAGQGEMIGRKETAGTAADDNGPVGRKLTSVLREAVDLRFN